MAEKTAKESTPDKAAAARAERKPKTKKLKFKGLDFTLPAELPETILFDFAEIEAAEDNPMPLFRLIRSILGSEQNTALRNAIGNGTLAAEDLPELIAKVFDKYGLTPGESTASQAS